MRAMQVAQRMTADEFLAGPENVLQRWELVGGELTMHEPKLPHQAAVDKLRVAFAFWEASDSRNGYFSSPLDIKLDEDNVYGPDILWYRKGRVPSLTDPAPYPMPDLIVEVRSPSTWQHDIGAKKAGYEAHGLPELWLADTEAKTILVYRRSKPSSAKFDVALELSGEQKLISPQLPGFELPVEAVFADR